MALALRCGATAGARPHHDTSDTKLPINDPRSSANSARECLTAAASDCGKLGCGKVFRAFSRMEKITKELKLNMANIFAERQSPAAHFLQEQGITRDDAVNFIVHCIAKGGGETAS
jgi:hypothetical protein